MGLSGTGWCTAASRALCIVESCLLIICQTNQPELRSIRTGTRVNFRNCVKLQSWTLQVHLKASQKHPKVLKRDNRKAKRMHAKTLAGIGLVKDVLVSAARGVCLLAGWFVGLFVCLFACSF